MSFSIQSNVFVHIFSHDHEQSNGEMLLLNQSINVNNTKCYINKTFGFGITKVTLLCSTWKKRLAIGSI